MPEEVEGEGEDVRIRSRLKSDGGTVTSRVTSDPDIMMKLTTHRRGHVEAGGAEDDDIVLSPCLSLSVYLSDLSSHPTIRLSISLD